MPCKFRVIYFPSRGRADVARWILAYSKADWEDVRVTKDEYPKIKADMPNGQLPVLEVTGEDGKVCKISQSATIVRALAHKFNLAGKTPKECVQADEVFETLRDIMQTAYEGMYASTEEKKAEMKKRMCEQVLPRNLKFLEKRLADNGGKYLIGGDCVCFFYI